MSESDLHFDVQLSWSGTGREGAGRVDTDDLVLELSSPGSMGGRAVGTNPEELLVSAVSSCSTATLAGMLRRAGLPMRSLAVKATVTGFPARARFARIVVDPTVIGGDRRRRDEYEATADAAHDRCFIGRTLAPEVAYEVGAVEMREGDAPPSARRERAVELHEGSTVEDADELPSGRAA
jgi:peroxiredoxin-like protein